jgi:hypothetical protein
LQAIEKHENKMSIVLKRQQLKKPCFLDFNGEVKVWALTVILLWHQSQTQHLILAQRV